jgi:hypothetical protein
MTSRSCFAHVPCPVVLLMLMRNNECLNFQNRYKALDISNGLDELGSINLPLLGCLAVIEVLCFLCIFKGVRLTGKVGTFY